MTAGRGDLSPARAGRADVAIGLLLLALSGGVFWLSRQIPDPPFVPLPPAFFPRLLAGLLAFVAILLVVQALRRGGVRRGLAGNRAPLGPAFVVFGWLAGYLGLVPLLGFFVTTFLFVAGLGFALSPRRRVDLVAALALGLVTTAVCLVVFTRYLHVLFPEGLLR